MPQKAQHVGVILDFLSWFLPEEPTPAAPVELFPPELPPVAAPQPVSIQVPLLPAALFSLIVASSQTGKHEAN